jgi:hypothetical protein
LAFFEDTSIDEFTESIGEDLRIGISDISTDLSETMMTLGYRLHDKYAPLFPEEGIELGHLRACAGWSVYHNYF